jgi:hypothetical protein
MAVPFGVMTEEATMADGFVFNVADDVDGTAARSVDGGCN